MKIIEKLKNLNHDQTQLLLEVNYGNNYAKKIYESRKVESREEVKKSEKVKIQRQLKPLVKDSWLKYDEKIKLPKNKKIYSLNWDMIMDSFIEYFIEETKRVLERSEEFASWDFNIEWNKEKTKFMKTSKTPEQKQRQIKQINEMKLSLKNIKKTKKSKYRSLLKPFFEKDVFVLAWERNIVPAHFDKTITMTDLFDETILGIGKALDDTKLKKIKRDSFFLTILTLCNVIFRLRSGGLKKSIESSFSTFLKI